ncbi:MAG: flavodoxin [Oscillospiraceae bacterium]|nr:flavodoxin [Oscillospiraceae bacterium]
MKTLIAYYSRTGVTRKAAEKLQKAAGGNLFEIKGTKDYGNYFTALGIARKEFSENELLEVTESVAAFDSYERILLGFPIWFSKCPQLILSFVSQYDFGGKDVYPFCTSGMSGADQAVELLKAACKGATVHNGLRMNKADESTIQKWLGGISS